MSATDITDVAASVREADQRFQEREAARVKPDTSERGMLVRLIREGTDPERAVEVVGHAFGRGPREIRAYPWFQDAIREGSEPEPAPASDPVAPEPVVAPDAIEKFLRDKRQEVAVLLQERQKLSPSAITGDAGAQGRLREVERELSAAEAAVEQGELAKVEQKRLDAEGAERAEAKARDDLDAKIVKLSAKALPLAEKIDKILRDLAPVVAEYMAVTGGRADLRSHRRELDGETMIGGSQMGGAVVGAVYHALDEQGLQRNINLRSPARAGALAESEKRDWGTN